MTDKRVPDETELEDGGQGVTRRRALQVLAATAATAATLPAVACAPESDGGSAGTDLAAVPGDRSAVVGNPLAAGTPTDPDLITPIVPWDLVLTDDELDTLASLCDVIIPGDDRSPSASSVGAHEFIDEWVSAPYAGNQDDLVQVRGGIVWLERESRTRFQTGFSDLSDDQKHEICDDICYEPNADVAYRSAARFFDKVRDLTSSAFWTTEEGMADLGFVGNRAMASFDGPPPEVLERLGLV